MKKKFLTEAEQLRKFTSIIEDDDYDDDDYEDDGQDDWDDLNDIRDPYYKLLHTLSTAFFNKYEDHPEFDSDYDDMPSAFDSAIAMDLFPGVPEDPSMEFVDALTPQQIEKMIDIMWQTEHGHADVTHDAPSRLQ